LSRGAASGGGAGSALFSLSHRYFPAFPLILATALAAPLAAQESGEGGIVTEQLEPLEPAGVGEDEAGAPRDSRFKPAPFRTLAIPEQAEPIEPVETVARQGARMRQLDKMTGRARTFEIAAGTEQMVDRLRLRLDACRSPDDNAQHGTMAFVQIWDTRRAGDPPVFSGWMFAESPALSALDHPRYDVWVISCTTSAGEAPAASE
jgi:hypothetical protein